ncbi:uncharacterized protein I206_104016 [Kwoniella pini CBS 10737]|uniref:NADH dehydrogenase (Ubiquinone) 1 beta subcomplex 8 n=1 Tax=Kwoniella pini CBS 10737 TaxID=1296096 RepID=A0A1B9I367_9TREE|nr:NADH dehydrogenase (ubiquinone) 1 beta subcomplex 8 [Kwoniella pini CBS 10737]OCF49881.1 NADH dehydrogenase (ubiquinone) 1 beta subcomplex 8 [Kwoniella pini CBS 10737]
MLRPTLLRTALPKRAIVTRFASTVAPSPVTTSGTPDVAETSYIPQRLSPGEEIDPQLNGYPQLPNISNQQREPFGWWDRQERKNFGEVMHESEDVIGMWGPDVHKTTPWSALFQLSVAFSLIGVASYALISNRPERPVAQRTYPFNGLEKELGGKDVAARPEEIDEE